MIKPNWGLKKILNVFLENKRGFLSILGAFLINLCAGIYNGTFGNILPYLTSYMRQVKFSIQLAILVYF